MLIFAPNKGVPTGWKWLRLYPVNLMQVMLPKGLCRTDLTVQRFSPPCYYLTVKQKRSMTKLQFITHHTPQYGYADGARMALEGGCRWIQLRMKDASEEEWARTGTEVARLCRLYGATFILDDHVELVEALQADGVHLGRNDMPVDEARRLLGPDRIIGGTANTLEDILLHAERGADYIGCGPFRFTTTKEKLAPTLGLDGYRHIVGGMRAAGLRLPLVAIGGITREDIPELMRTGIDGIAMSGAILRAGNPAEETRKILEALTNKQI